MKRTTLGRSCDELSGFAVAGAGRPNPGARRAGFESLAGDQRFMSRSTSRVSAGVADHASSHGSARRRGSGAVGCRSAVAPVPVAVVVTKSDVSVAAGSNAPIEIRRTTDTCEPPPDSARRPSTPENRPPPVDRTAFSHLMTSRGHLRLPCSTPQCWRIVMLLWRLRSGHAGTPNRRWVSVRTCGWAYDTWLPHSANGDARPSSSVAS